MNSYDIIADKVREYWKETYPHDVIVFFYQKYNFESKWEWHQELVQPYGSSDYETVVFDNDFCEGQTETKDINIVSLEKIIQFYLDNFNTQ